MDGISQLLWPRMCDICGKNDCIADKNFNLCQDCWSNLTACCSGTYCQYCGCEISPYAVTEIGCPICIDAQFSFDGIVRVGLYKEALRSVILKYKNSKSHFSKPLGVFLSSAMDNCSFANKIDFLVPVPLHWKRKLKRGYNQSFLLANKLSGFDISTDLIRIKDTKTQASLSFKKRQKNVRGAFDIRKGHPFENANICLIDDIKTTGATLNECANILKQAGAKKVFAIVLSTTSQHLATR